MGARTTTTCDQCGVVIDPTAPAFYLTTKRKAPSVDADLCSAECVGAMAARLARPAYTPNPNTPL